MQSKYSGLDLTYEQKVALSNYTTKELQSFNASYFKNLSSIEQKDLKGIGYKNMGFESIVASLKLLISDLIDNDENYYPQEIFDAFKVKDNCCPENTTTVRSVTEDDKDAEFAASIVLTQLAQIFPKTEIEALSKLFSVLYGKGIEVERAEVSKDYCMATVYLWDKNERQATLEYYTKWELLPSFEEQGDFEDLDLDDLCAEYDILLNCDVDDIETEEVAWEITKAMNEQKTQNQSNKIYPPIEIGKIRDYLRRIESKIKTEMGKSSSSNTIGYVRLEFQLDRLQIAQRELEIAYDGLTALDWSQLNLL